MPRAIWNVRTSPTALIRSGRSRVISWPSKMMRPRVGRHQPGDAVEQRGLARAVRADQAGDASRLDREVDAVQRLHAIEAARDLMTIE